MEGAILKPDLRVPEQKTTSLTFCDTAPKPFRKWAKQLPMANIGEASRQLYHAIIELNHLSIAPRQRLQLLELIREKIHFVCNELSRHYLGLAVALPEKQRKIAPLPSGPADQHQPRRLLRWLANRCAPVHPGRRDSRGPGAGFPSCTTAGRTRGYLVARSRPPAVSASSN